MTDFLGDIKGILQAGERIILLVPRVAGSIRTLLRSQRYEHLSENMMEMDARGKKESIESQSRLLKRPSLWRLQFVDSPRWAQIEEFWSMPAGTRLYIEQRATINGRRRTLFGLVANGSPLRFWAEKV
jgi:hypothetical protein